MTLTELRKQATFLVQAQHAITNCCAALGDWETNNILAKLNSAAKEINDKIEILEGRHGIESAQR